MEAHFAMPKVGGGSEKTARVGGKRVFYGKLMIADL